MKLTDKEALKVLAKAVKDYCFQSVEIRYCKFCNRVVSKAEHNHDTDCPVLLAEEVLKEKECSSCKGTGKIFQPYISATSITTHYMCPKCNGTEVKE